MGARHLPEDSLAAVLLAPIEHSSFNAVRRRRTLRSRPSLAPCRCLPDFPHPRQVDAQAALLCAEKQAVKSERRQLEDDVAEAR